MFCSRTKRARSIARADLSPSETCPRFVYSYGCVPFRRDVSILETIKPSMLLHFCLNVPLILCARVFYEAIDFEIVDEVHFFKFSFSFYLLYLRERVLLRDKSYQLESYRGNCFLFFCFDAFVTCLLLFLSILRFVVRTINLAT